MWFPTPDADEIVHFTILLSKRDATRGRRGYPSLLAGRYESLVTARAASGVRRLCPPARGRRTRRRSVRHLFASARPESTLSADSIGLMSRLRTDVAVIPTRLVKGGGDRQPEALSRGQARVIPEDAEPREAGTTASRNGGVAVAARLRRQRRRGGCRIGTRRMHARSTDRLLGEKRRRGAAASSSRAAGARHRCVHPAGGASASIGRRGAYLDEASSPARCSPPTRGEPYVFSHLASRRGGSGRRRRGRPPAAFHAALPDPGRSPTRRRGRPGVLGPKSMSVLQPPPADEAAGEGEEAFVDVVAAVGANEEAVTTRRRRSATKSKIRASGTNQPLLNGVASRLRLRA